MVGHAKKKTTIDGPPTNHPCEVGISCVFLEPFYVYDDIDEVPWNLIFSLEYS